MDIGIDQLMAVVRQLPAGQLNRLKRELGVLAVPLSKTKKVSLEKLLLSGPCMSGAQVKEFSDIRSRLTSWRTE